MRVLPAPCCVPPAQSKSCAVSRKPAVLNVPLLRDSAQVTQLDRYTMHIADAVDALPKEAAGQKVLNLLAYTCAFSVAALQGGARHVLNIDMAAGAIAIGQHNHALNGLKERASFMSHDIFKTWGKITRGGAYGLVIVDPPSYQKGSFVAGKDYPRLLRRLNDLVAPGGHALLCLNAPEIGSAFLQDQVREHAPELVFEQRLPNPPVFADIDPERALKVLVYRAPELPISTPI